MADRLSGVNRPDDVDPVRARPRGDLLRPADARSAYEQAGLRGFWRGYFAGRAAPLGPANAAVVTASFFNFAPAFVARAIPGVWELITPDEALRVRLAGRDRRPAAACSPGRKPRWRRRPICSGRRSGNWTSPAGCWPRRTPRCRHPTTAWPGSGRRPPCCANTGATGTSPRSRRLTSTAARLWPCAACLDLRRENLQPVRGWTDEAWDDALRPAGRARLGRRGRGAARQRGPGGARGGGGRHRPGRGAAVGSARTGGCGGDRARPHPARAGLRERASLP